MKIGKGPSNSGVFGPFDRHGCFALICALFAGCSMATAADGSLDPGWGVAGAHVFNRASLNDRVKAAVALADGGLILAGTCEIDLLASPWITSMCVAKLDPAGAPALFGGANGVPVVYSTVAGFPARTAGNSVSLLRDGGLLIAGTVNGEPDADLRVAAFVVRLDDTGALDLEGTASGTGYSSFSFAPERVASFNAINDTAVTPRGDIIAVGSVMAGDSIKELSNTNFGIARLRPDLQLDESFAIGGTREVAVDQGAGGIDIANAVSIDRQERIVVVGSAFYAAQGAGQSAAIAIVRLEPDGSIDFSFGDGDGQVTLATEAGTVVAGSSVSHDSEGRILVCGTAHTLTESGARGAIVVARLLANGEPDTSFGNGGAYPGMVLDQVGFAGPGSQDSCSAVMVQRDGNTIMAGSAEVDVVAGIYDGAPITMRRLADGTRDQSYGLDGIALAHMNPDVAGLRSEGLSAMAADRRGGAYFVGGLSRSTPFVSGQSAYSFAAARVLNGVAPELPMLADGFE